MKRNNIILFFSALLFVAFVVLNMPKQASENILYLPSTVPPDIREDLQRLFPKYRQVENDMNTIPTFIREKDIVFSFDIQALPLIEAGAGYYFEPLYYDTFVIATDANEIGHQIASWKDLSKAQRPVSFPYTDPAFCCLVTSYSITTESKGDISGYIQLLRSLRDKSRLRFDDPSAPIQVLLLSEAITQLREGRELHLSLPAEGGVCFVVGLFSKHPISEEILDDLRSSYSRSAFPQDMREIQSLLLSDEEGLFAAEEVWEEFSRLYEPTAAVRRNVLEQRKYAPADGQESHLMALTIIALIILSLTYVSFHVVHPGIRRGIWLMGLLLVLWIIFMRLKYAMPNDRYAHLSIAMWYAYYLFILAIPIVSLYIAENSDRSNRTLVSGRLIFCVVISALLALMVLTNDHHQMVFLFFSEDRRLNAAEYKRNWGYYAVTAWFFFGQLAAFAQLFLQNWSSPKKRQMILPLIIFILGILYVPLYNFDFKPVSEIPLPFSVSVLIISYFALAIFSGLIQSNRHYVELFQESTLNMQIFDSTGQLRYQTRSATKNPSGFILDCSNTLVSNSSLHGNLLIWQHPVSGGTLVSKEDISNVLTLQSQLQQATEQLKKENKILSEKHTVEGRLLFLQEQSRLLAEVNKNTESKIRQMKHILADPNVPDEDKLKKIHLLSIYCKRRCEQLIYFRREKSISGQELCRILFESAQILSPVLTAFCTLEGSYPEERAVRLYDTAHDFFQFVINQKIKQTTLKIHPTEDAILFYAMFDRVSDGEIERLRKKPNASVKDLGDAISITVKMTDERRHQ